MSRPYALLVSLSAARCVRVEGEKGWGVRVLSWCANTRAHGERGRGEEGGRGGLAGRTVVAWLGAVVVLALACSLAWCVQSPLSW